MLKQLFERERVGAKKITQTLVPWNRGSLHKARGHFVGWRGGTT